MIAIRRLTDGIPSDRVEVLVSSLAQNLIRDGLAIPANGKPPAPVVEAFPRIDPRTEVLGLTDRDPDFFDKQAEDEARRKGDEKGLDRSPLDRMMRRGVRKGG